METDTRQYIVLDKIELLVNKIISLDEDARKKLVSLNKKIIEIDIQGTAIHVFLLPNEDGISLRTSIEEEVDVIVAGSPSALLGMVSSEKIGAGNVQITGNVGLAQNLQTIFKQLDVDWEELLSRYIGDIAAHKLGNIAKQLNQFFVRTGRTIGMDISEYLRFEKNAVLDETELEEFNQAVDHLRNDVERLSKRFERLDKESR